MTILTPHFAQLKNNIYKKPAPSIFERKPSRYVCNCWSHPWSPGGAPKKKEHLPPSKTAAQQLQKAVKQKLLQLQVKKLAYLPYRCALSIRHLYRSHPLWLAAFGPNDGVSRNDRVEAFYLDINSDEFKVTVKYHQDFLLDDMSLKKLSGMSWGGKSSTSSHFLKFKLAACCQNSPKPKKPSKWWF